MTRLNTITTLLALGSATAAASADLVIYDNSAQAFVLRPFHNSPLQSYPGDYFDPTRSPAQNPAQTGTSLTAHSITYATSSTYFDDYFQCEANLRIARDNTPITLGSGFTQYRATVFTLGLLVGPDTVGVTNSWQDHASFSYSHPGVFDPVLGQSPYVGIRLTLPDGIHYGWIKFDWQSISLNGGSGAHTLGYTPIAWAYESLPDVPALIVATPELRWTVINLHPAGATESVCYGVQGGQQVGYVGAWPNQHASLWNGSAASWVDLHPMGAGHSVALTVNGGQQAGYVSGGGAPGAGVWSGSPTSWGNLSPAGAMVYGLSGGQRVGYADLGGFPGAVLWNTEAFSWVVLHPAGATESYAYGMSGDQQAGFARVGGTYRASLWTGTAASWISLHPAGAVSSYIFGVGDGQQVGRASILDPDNQRASLWSGTAASWVDLSPAGTFYSEADGVHAGQQVGQAVVGENSHASLWSGTAASWVDLHTFVAPDFINTFATAIWHDGTITYVVGYGYNLTTGRNEALMWVRSPVTCYANCDGSSAPPILNANDFQCFLNEFAAGNSYANCDGSTAAPVLNANDFQCFLNNYAAGCS